ncbi:MAG: hypothetical protein AB1813_29900, partial [Verrucomicrobiota bacterium]
MPIESNRMRTVPFKGLWCLLALLMAGGGRTLAQPLEMPRPDYWVPNSTVSAIAVVDDLVFVGGWFEDWRPDAPRCDLFDNISGARESSFPQIDGAVYAAIPDGDGGWFLGGEFTRVGGLIRRNLARVLADHTVDSDWHPEVPGLVLALTRIEDSLFVGGMFDSASGEPRKNLAAFHRGSGELLPWNPVATHSLDGVVQTWVQTLVAFPDR